MTNVTHRLRTWWTSTTRVSEENRAAMAHPETGELVPACVQHSVLDPAENLALRLELPLTPGRRLLPLTPVTAGA